MKLTVISKDVQKSLKTLTNITSAEHAVAEILKKKLTLSAYGNNSSIRLHLTPDKINNSKNPFTFNVSVLNGVLKGRGKIELDSGDDEEPVKFCSPKAKSYSGNFMVLPQEEVTIENLDSKGVLNLSKDMQEALSKAINSIAVHDIYTEDPMLLIVTADNKGITVICCDSFHLAMYKNSEVKSKKKIEFTVPVKTFDVINELSEGEKYKLAIGESVIYARNTNFEVNMPLVQAAAQHSYKDVMSYMKKIRDKAQISFVIKTDELIRILDNTLSIHDEGAAVTMMSGKKSTVRLGINSTYGKAVESIKVVDKNWKKEDLKIKFDPHLLLDCLNLITAKQIPIAVIGNSLYIDIEKDSERLFYACNLVG